MRAHVEAAHIEAADVRLELDDVMHALTRVFQGGSRAGLFRILAAGHESRSRPGGQVDENPASTPPDAVHDLAVERELHARSGGLGIAHVDMDNGCSRLGSVER